MAAPPPNLKVAITIHVAFERTVLKYAGLYDDTVTVKSIVDANLAKACESAARSLIFESASTFASAEDMRVPGTLLNAADTAFLLYTHDLEMSVVGKQEVHAVYAVVVPLVIAGAATAAPVGAV